MPLAIALCPSSVPGYTTGDAVVPREIKLQPVDEEWPQKFKAMAQAIRVPNDPPIMVISSWKPSIWSINNFEPYPFV